MWGAECGEGGEMCVGRGCVKSQMVEASFLVVSGTDVSKS